MEIEHTVYFAVGLLLILVVLLIKKFTSGETTKKAEAPNNAPQARAGRPAAQRQAAVRNRRGARNRVARDSDSERDEEAPAAREEDSDDALQDKLADMKMGTKKKAKLEAKAEKKAQREAEERLREERKKKEAAEEHERQQREEKEAEEQRNAEEEERKRLEEKERKEREEYEMLKAAFTVEGEGCEAATPEEEGNLIEQFVNHVKEKKVVLFEELATHFSLKVPEALNRLETLVAEKRLTGVMDDRGKFIYISEAELENFAKFIKQRGRVSIAELVENSASFISLSTEQETVNSSA